MSRIIKATVNEADYATLKEAANRAHGGDVAGYVRTAALEKARLRPTVLGGALDEEALRRMLEGALIEERKQRENG